MSASKTSRASGSSFASASSHDDSGHAPRGARAGLAPWRRGGPRRAAALPCERAWMTAASRSAKSAPRATRIARARRRSTPPRPRARRSALGEPGRRQHRELRPRSPPRVVRRVKRPSRDEEKHRDVTRDAVVEPPGLGVMRRRGREAKLPSNPAVRELLRHREPQGGAPRLGRARPAKGRSPPARVVEKEPTAASAP